VPDITIRVFFTNLGVLYKKDVTMDDEADIVAEIASVLPASNSSNIVFDCETVFPPGS